MSNDKSTAKHDKKKGVAGASSDPGDAKAGSGSGGAPSGNVAPKGKNKK